MNIPDNELQKALEEYQEWGEKLRTPVKERIAGLFPHHNQFEIAEILTVCENAHNAAWILANEVRDNNLSMDHFIKQIRTLFPFMSEKNASRTYSQAMYETLK